MEAVQDQQFVDYVVRALVNHPDDVRTERTVDEMGVLITLHINQEDMGYVIGRRGQTARAVRTLLRVVGAKNNARVNLKIYEPEEARLARMEREGRRPEDAQGHPSDRGPRQPSRQEAREDIDTSAVDDLTI